MLKALNKLKLWDGNYNQGNIGAIAISIRRFGFDNNPRIWKGDEVRGGNHTVMALRQIQKEGADPKWDMQFPPMNIMVKKDDWYIDCVDISYLSESEALAYAIADNNIGKEATENNEILLPYLVALHKEDENLLLATAYDPEDIAHIAQIIGEVSPDAFFDGARSDKRLDSDNSKAIARICPKCGHEFMDGAFHE